MSGKRPFSAFRSSLLALAVLASAPWMASPLDAGAYIFAGEANGVDLILHPQGYTGVENLLTVEVCIDPASLVPSGFALTDFEQAVRNNVDIWNQLQPIVGNSLLGSNNNVPSGQLDFESVALHEVGHCIGLAHVNAASESGLPGANTNYTKATDGINGVFDINPGVDGVIGSSDDVRGDDVNLHWFRTDTNDPGELQLPVPVDNATYDRDQSSLPAGHLFAANLDRTVAGLLGYPDVPGVVDTEAVMQQGSFSDEDQRRLTADGAGTILLAMSGADETAGTADDYVINLVYGGISGAASCDLTMSFTAMGGLAFCSVGGSFISSPPGTTHARITTGFMEFGVGFNWFANPDGPCRQELDLVTGQWKQIALSCDPPSGANTVADLFGDDLTGTYDVNWVVYERDAANDTYVKLQLTDPLTVGRGYWIKTNQASQTINIEEDFNTTGDFPLEADPAGRFNMVGHRFWYDEAWNDVRVIDPGNPSSPLTLAEVDPGGACQGPNPVANGCIMSRVAHKWNGAAYEAFNGQTAGAEGTLENFDGFWVKAFKSGISLRIPDQRSTPSNPHDETLEPLPEAGLLAVVPETAPAANARATARLRDPRRPPPRPEAAPWFMRLIAESGELRDAGNVLGQLADSHHGPDAHDLLELAPFAGDHLSIVFPHEDWGDRSGDYTTDYRALGPARGGSWRFDVLTSEPASEITLRWEGDEEQIRGTYLINHTTREKIDVQPDGSYTFVATAERNLFSWQVGRPGMIVGRRNTTPPWFIRLIVETGTLVDSANVFGQAESSVDGYDAFDLAELDPFGTNYLTIVFPHPDWGAQAGNYTSDYHSYKPYRKREAWNFEVRSSDPSAEIVLRWEGPADRLERSVLIDPQTNTVLRPEPGGTYTLTMTDTTRALAWHVFAPAPDPRPGRAGRRR